MTARSIRRRFLLLRGLRWLPTGLLMPVLVLLLVERGLTIGQVGLALGVQGVVVMVLELPTGGLADAWGRRNVLLVASAVDLASIVVLVAADTLPLVLGVFALQGVYRALESGPLDAWFVDRAEAVDPGVDIEAAMGAGGAVIGVAIALGSVIGSGLVAADPAAAIDPLVVPVIVSAMVRLVELVTIAVAMTDPTTPRPAIHPGIGGVIRDGLATIRASRALVALLAIEAVWGAGMVAFETLTPARLGAALDDPTAAAAVLGPASAAGWLLAGATAAAVPSLMRRAGPPLVGFGLRVAQGVAVAGIALLTGPAGIVVALLATMAVHGAANPVHQALLHRAVTDSRQRATVLSGNSLAGNLGAAAGAIGLGVVADATTLSTAVLVGAALLAAAAPLYLRTATTRTGGRRSPVPT